MKLKKDSWDFYMYGVYRLKLLGSYCIYNVFQPSQNMIWATV